MCVQVFRCASGVYVIGNQGPIDSVSAKFTNDLFVSKMLDDAGTRCTPKYCTSNRTLLLKLFMFSSDLLAFELLTTPLQSVLMPCSSCCNRSCIMQMCSESVSK